MPKYIEKSNKAHELVFIKNYQPFLEYKQLAITLQKDFDRMHVENEETMAKYSKLIEETKHFKIANQKLKDQLLGLEYSNHKKTIKISNLNKFNNSNEFSNKLN
jgi:hypothetical protein